MVVTPVLEEFHFVFSAAVALLSRDAFHFMFSAAVALLSRNAFHFMLSPAVALLSREEQIWVTILIPHSISHV